jgi:hypothetical protein
MKIDLKQGGGIYILKGVEQYGYKFDIIICYSGTGGSNTLR